MRLLPKFSLLLCIFLLGSLVLFRPVEVIHADLTCTASVSPSSVPVDSTTSFTFTINNTSEADDIAWIQVTRPSSNFTFGGFTSLSGWGSSVTSDAVTLLYGTVDPQGSMNFGINVISGSSEAPSANWTVQTSTNEDGADPVSCSGSLGKAISGAGADTTAPTISDIVVSGISDTQATISWTTDESSTSVVEYGSTDDYGSTATGDTGMSHSVTISSLTANTTYHYNVKSTDGSDNEGESGDNTFTTAVAGTTTTTTVTGTTRTVTATPTPTPKPDTSPPKVTVSTDIDKVFTVAPTIKGTATDPSGVATLEYSLDDGRSWLPVDTIATPGKSSTTFEFIPESLLDDNYELKIRASDLKGNTGETAIGTLVIDRLPPRIGGNVASLGPQILVPMPDGSYIIPAGIDFKLTLSAVGGPTSIDLGYLGDSGALVKTPLAKNLDNGLWSGVFHFDTPGMYRLTAYAVDGADNISTRDIATVVVVPNGQVTTSAGSGQASGGVPVTHGTVSVYYLDDTMKRFVLWDGSPYGQTNPAPLDGDGRYRLYLPAGTYYVAISAGGYKSLVSSIFTLPAAYPVVTNFTLERARAIKIWKWLIPLPDFRQTTATVTVAAPTSGSNLTALLLTGKELPYFRLASGTKTITSLDLRGKPTIMTFLNTWLPLATSQMAILDEVVKKKELNVIVIVPQESVSSVAIYTSRGGYTVPIVADPDGELVEPLMLSSMPTHIIVNRKGVITDVASGVFNKDELFDMIIQ
jgi:hypothetical protein